MFTNKLTVNLFTIQLFCCTIFLSVSSLLFFYLQDESEDYIKRQQLRELAMLNSNFSWRVPAQVVVSHHLTQVAWNVQEKPEVDKKENHCMHLYYLKTKTTCGIEWKIGWRIKCRVRNDSFFFFFFFFFLFFWQKLFC